MWLSSEMVDSYFIRAIVCSGQKEPKKTRQWGRLDPQKSKSGQIYTRPKVNQLGFIFLDRLTERRLQIFTGSKVDINKIQSQRAIACKKQQNCWQNSCITQIWRRKLFLGCILGLRWDAGLRLFYAARGVKFEKWKWNLRSESENLKVNRGEEEIISENKAFKVFDPIMFLLNEIESKYDFWGWLIFATARIETKSQSENCVGN